MRKKRSTAGHRPNDKGSPAPDSEKQRRLQECEKRITEAGELIAETDKVITDKRSQTTKAFHDRAVAFWEISRDELYQPYRTFDEYSKKRWGHHR